MPSQGPNNGSTFVGDSTVGTVDWTSPELAQLSDDQWAYAYLSSGQSSYYLKATGFGFTIPTGSTINGIVVEVERSRGGLGQDAWDNSVKIVKGNTIQGNEKANSTEWPTSDTYITYGGSTDLWGLTWTVAQINASDFGFVISAKSITPGGTSLIDHIRITVYYTLGGQTYYQTLPATALGSLLLLRSLSAFRSLSVLETALGSPILSRSFIAVRGLIVTGQTIPSFSMLSTFYLALSAQMASLTSVLGVFTATVLLPVCGYVLPTLLRSATFFRGLSATAISITTRLSPEIKTVILSAVTACLATIGVKKKKPPKIDYLPLTGVG